MKNSVLKSITILLFFFVSFLSLGQTTKPIPSKGKIDTTQSDQLVMISLKSGNELIGLILSQTDEGVVILTQENLEIKLKWKDISSIVDINKTNISTSGVYQRPNLQSTRYFFGPNGHGLKKGEGYYQNVWIFFNQASVGVTDNFSISAGIVPAFLFMGAPTPVWVIPKVSVPIKEDVLSIGVGGLFGTVIGEGTNFGIGFGTFTLGDRNHNLSVSVGYGMMDGSWNSNPVITISGMTRVSKKTYLLTENFIFPGNVTLLSFGARSFAGNIGLDYGLFVPLDAGIFIAVPWLGITVPFGKF